MTLRAAVLAGAVALALPAAAAAEVPQRNVWLCHPAVKVDYCNTDLSTTVVWPDGSRSTVKLADAKPPIDCFYVYPTVSTEKRGNADLKIRNEEKYVPLAQAARFRRSVASSRRSTGRRRSTAAAAPTSRMATCVQPGATTSRTGTALERLIRDQYGSLKHLLVSALLLGGDVAVGGDERFAGLLACRSLAQTGCIVAYSSWSRTPPTDAGLQSVGSPGEHVLCVNPAAPGGGSGTVTPIFPWFLTEGITPGPLTPQPRTLWVAFPELYTARCVRQGTRSWLLVTRSTTASDPRPTVRPVLSPRQGLHAADVNVALGALINLIRAETKAYTASH